MSARRRASILAWASVGGAAVLAGAASRAEACAACGCGDPTLTSMGAEIPYEGRLRASLEARVRTDAVGEEGVDRIDMVEGRLEGSVAWAPDPRFMAQVMVPFLHREVTYVNLAERTTTGLGDVELRGRFVLFRDRPFGPRHLVATSVGLGLPTTPEVVVDGEPLPVELQPGTGAFVPILGLAYATFRGDTSVYTSAHAYFPLSIRPGGRPGSSLRGSASVQQQLAEWIGIRGGVDVRLDARATEDGRPEEDSGGFVGFLSPEVLVQPVTDLLFVASVRIPTVNLLVGDHDEGVIASLAAAVDF